MKRTEKEKLLDIIPKPDPKIIELIKMTEQDLDKEFIKQKKREEKIINELGKEKGEEKILEEGMELLVERLNKFQNYFEEIENWKETIAKDYELVKKN